MAVAHVDADWDVKADGSSTTHVYAGGQTITAGHLIVVGIKYRGVTGNVTAAVTDSLGNTYVQAPFGYVDGSDDGVGMNRMTGFYAKNVTGGSGYTITITYSAAVSSDNSVLAFHIISGADATAPLVGNVAQAQAAPGTGSNAITSTAITPSAANSYLFGAFSGFQGATTVTAGTGFTAGVNIGAVSSNFNISTEYLIQGAAASQAATFTENTSLSNTITQLMAFKPSGAAQQFSLACDGSSYAITGADVTVIQQAIQTWLRVGR